LDKETLPDKLTIDSKSDFRYLQDFNPYVVVCNATIMTSAIVAIRGGCSGATNCGNPSRKAKMIANEKIHDMVDATAFAAAAAYGNHMATTISMAATLILLW
jgi:hypothetical protein